MFQVEHVAWQVNDPPAVAKWYVDTLGFRVLRKMDAAPFTHFLVDAGGRVVMEIYHNPVASVPDYRSMNPLHLHLAFAVDQPEAARAKLLEAGATNHEDAIITPAGDKLIMLRDPFGFPIQLCKRAKPMLG
jgi:catechol 2,3-dioxygenase-like lactoylglutathione lyase family enzyme